eukprot:Gb_17118 [translate_table: standard]
MAAKSTSTIPPLFRCPISLELMKDPVTLSTGVTYDRESIERWFQEGHSSCPSTMQTLDTLELTPNHTLRRLIQGWCTSNPGHGIDRIPIPKAPAGIKQVEQLLFSIRNAPMKMENLTKLAALAKESEHNRISIAASGGITVLISALFTYRIENESELLSAAEAHVEEGLAILANILIHESKEECRKHLTGPRTIDTICWFLCRGSFRARLHAAQVLHGILTIDQNFKIVFRADEECFENLALLLRDVCPLATKTAMEILLIISPVRRNRIKVVETGAVVTLIEILPEAERNVAEKALSLLEILCQSAEGRASVCENPLGIPVLVKKIARVSELATEAATGALWHICKNCRTPSVLQDLDEAGASPKLFLLLQIGCSSNTRQRAKEILRAHKGRSSRDNPCILMTDQLNGAVKLHVVKLAGCRKN